jgi:hypothetical protein
MLWLGGLEIQEDMKIKGGVGSQSQIGAMGDVMHAF